MAPYDAREDWLVSVHEAGHTVLAAEYGFEPTYAEIHLVKIGWGKVVGCGVTFMEKADPDDKFNLASVCYAGQAAEALVPHLFEGATYRAALQEAMVGAGSDYASAQSLYLEDNPVWAAMQLRAAKKNSQRFVAENWPEIEFIAREIRIQRHLNFTPQERQV